MADKKAAANVEEMMASAIQKLASTQEKIASAVEAQAVTNSKLANEMRVLTTAIRGAHNLVVENTKKTMERSDKMKADLAEFSKQIKEEKGGPRGKTS